MQKFQAWLMLVGAIVVIGAVGASLYYARDALPVLGKLAIIVIAAVLVGTPIFAFVFGSLHIVEKVVTIQGKQMTNRLLSTSDQLAIYVQPNGQIYDASAQKAYHESVGKAIGASTR